MTTIAQQPRANLVHVTIAWTVAVLTGFYMLPWAIAATRARPNEMQIALINALLGWTLIGWIASLVMAFRND
jgi:T4 superinfection immunity protein